MKKALQIFRKYDTEKNGFISSTLIEEVLNEMREASIVTATPIIDELKRRMDPDGLQIITESAFIQEFFPRDQFVKTNLGKPFVICHYNGLPRSNQNKQVRYAIAEAIIDDYGYGNEIPASAVAPVVPGTHLPITDVLRTKWPTIELKWDDEAKPSLN